MISIRDAEEILKKEYHIDNFKYVIKELLLPDFAKDEHEVYFNNNLFESVTQLGTSEKCDVTIYEVILKEGAQNRRVTITQEMFRILRGQGINNAIVAFSNADYKNYRLSLLTSKYEFEGDKIVKILSNPRRYSYSLGYGTKTKTAYEFLISKGKVNSLEELIGRFSVEVVNKQFYNEIAVAFTKLVGGTREGKTYAQELGIHGVTDKNKYAEFAVRLIGRIVFCWFLKEKKSENGIPLVPESMLSVESTNTAGIYYHDVLEPLFFELLNTKQERRKGKFAKEEIYAQIPYLNGGLFSPHQDDHYKYAFATESGTYGLVNIPNDWFTEFYGVLSQYNFTVDENTSYDIELSIDPEMLGRIFENLLAEINPETGENAKKSTGSFYTPRDIVDYMVDNSIFEYLKGKTNIEDERLKALISYGKEDDELAVFSKVEKKAIINALYTVTVLDPACGSGAFPIGMLQKIVYILQEVDPEANLWFDKATENISILMKREFEKKFNAGSLDYIRKLSVIQNSIFGVDIQPIAVEIARLRCFLSLVIEEKVDDNDYNRGVNPLPNLDFKFIIANTLKELPKESDVKFADDAMQISMVENQDHIAELKAVREEYFSVNDASIKSELRYQFSEIQNAMLSEALNVYRGNNTSKLYRALFEWKPFENVVTDWFDPEWMFGVRDGFDIVLGNPPYVVLQGNNKSSDLSYFKKKYEVAKYKVDLYHLFIEKSIKSIKANGICTLITPSNFTSNNYCEPLRKYILNNTDIISIVFYDENVFQASVNNLVFLAKKAHSGSNEIKFSFVKKDEESWNEFKKVAFPQEFFEKEGSLLIPPSSDECSVLMDKIESQNCLLESVCQVNFGMQLRDRRKFPQDVTNETDRLTEFHKICYTGKDIFPYGVYVRERYCYFNREAKCGGCWDENVQLAVPKLLVRQIGDFPVVGIDNNGYPLLNTGFIISQFKGIDIHFLLGYLNSKIVKFYWTQKFGDNRKQFPKIKGTYLEKIPLRRNEKIEKEVASLSVEIVKLISKGEDYLELEKSINDWIYKLFEFTNNEIELVEKVLTDEED